MTARVERLFPGVYLLHSVVGGRPLQLALLIGKDASILIDSGCASDVDRVILPALRELGLAPGDISSVLNTHCDVDHQGGNAGLMQLASHARLLCGAADQAEIESPEVIMEQRYDAYRQKHDIFYDEPTTAWLREELGSPRKVDVTLAGGEIIRLASDWALEVLHLPGHSKGHVGIWDRKNHVLFGGDAVQGEAYLDLHGAPVLCPTYLHVRPYLETLRRVEETPPQVYVGCHWPVCYGTRSIRRFCRKSRHFVEQSEQVVLHYLRARPQGSCLKQLCDALGSQLGHWPTRVNRELCYAFAGHLVDLATRQLIRTEPGFPMTFHAV